MGLIDIYLMYLLDPFSFVMFYLGGNYGENHIRNANG